MLCQSHLHTASENLVRHKKKKKKMDQLKFSAFCLRSKHFDRKGWRKKNVYENFRLCVQGPLCLPKQHLFDQKYNKQ